MTGFAPRAREYNGLRDSAFVIREIYAERRWRRLGMMAGALRLLLFSIAALAALPPAQAQTPAYEFLAAPQINLSLVYRLDKASGEIIACQYGHNPGRTDIEPGAFGVTVCYRSGEGAGKQEPGQYGLIATRHEQEGGVFRVDYRSGSLSICYLYFQKEKQGDREVITDQYVVCTPPTK